MANLATVTDNMLPVANETFIDNLSAGISAGAAIVPINSLAEYADGDSVVLTVDPGTASQATFIGEKQGNTVIDCKWTEGNVGASHTAGATVIDYDSATHYNVVTKLLRMFANENGSLKTSAVQAALNISSAVPADWTPLATAGSIVASRGQREFDLLFSAVDYTDRLRPGTKLKIPRTVAVPTQSAQFVSASSQYARKTGAVGIAQTDDITIEATINIPSYSATRGAIVSTLNAGATAGFIFALDSTGQVIISGYNAGTVYRGALSYQSVPLNKNVHIAATLDMSANSCLIYIDGVLVPSAVTGGAVTSFAASSELTIGAYSYGTQYFNGVISDVRLWSTVRTTAQIRDNARKQLAGSEAGLVGYWKLDGNFADSTANANTLTPAGGAIATYSGHPFNANEYAIVTATPVYSAGNTTVTVFCPWGGGIPNETLGVSSYSTARSPYGFPASKSQWTVEVWGRVLVQQVTPASNTWYNVGSIRLKIPVGEWVASYKVKGYVSRASGEGSVITTISTGASTDSTNGEFQMQSAAMSQTDFNATHFIRRPLGTIATATDYYLNLQTNSGVNGLYLTGSTTSAFITAECAYL